jgi:hypothetical protein
VREGRITETVMEGADEIAAMLRSTRPQGIVPETVR